MTPVQMRARLFGRLIAPEMIALSLVEMALTFTLALVMLTPAAGSFTMAVVNPALACALTVGFTAFVIGLYRPEVFARSRNLLVNTVLSALLSFPAVWILSKAFGVSGYWPVGYDPLRPLKIVFIWSTGVVCIRLLFLIAARCNMFLHRVAIIGSDDPAVDATFARVGRKGFLEITSIQPEQASAAGLRSARVRTLIFAGNSLQFLPPTVLDKYEQQGISVQSQSTFWEKGLRRIDIENLNEDQLRDIRLVETSRPKKIVLRVFDIVTSLGLLITTLPLMAVVALVVRLESVGPILYRQERVGLHDQTFTLLKFRSMRVNAEAAGPSWAQQKDPRVTRIGLFLRKTRIDELPQLLNILRGQMSFIGPRPERPHFVEQLSRLIPSYRERTCVKPGLTGWAQVNYPYGASVEDARSKLSYDLYYVKNRSLALDLLILLSTIRVILLQEGAR